MHVYDKHSIATLHINAPLIKNGVKSNGVKSNGVKSQKFSQGAINQNLIHVKLDRQPPTIPNRKLSLSVVNPCSIAGPKGKTQDFLDYVISTKSDLCVLTETFLTTHHDTTRAQLNASGYAFDDQPRLTGAARGGTGLFYRDCFKVKKTCFGQKTSFEYSEWLVTWSNKRLKICIIYHPPYSQNNRVSNSDFLDEFEEYLETVVLSDEMLCICGDFNIHMNKPADQHQIRLSDMLTGYGLLNHINFPTHKEGNTLDLVITRNNGELNISNTKPGYFISDHCFVHVQFSTPSPNLTIKSISYRKIKSIDLPAFKSDLFEICRELDSIEDIETLARQYNVMLSDCLDKHAPMLNTTLLSRPKVKWYNDDLKCQKRARRKAERKWRDSNLTSDENIFKTARNKYVSNLDKAHVQHYQNEISEASGNQKKLFSIIQELASVHRDNPLPDHESVKQLADQFGDFFINKIETIRSEIDTQPCISQSADRFEQPGVTLSSFKPLSQDEVRKLIMKSKTTSCDLDPIPSDLLKECIDVILPILTKMVNLSLQSGVFPNEWKLALVIPLIKKFGLDTIFKNYRPVSNLPFVSKLVERAAVEQDSGHIKIHCPLPDCASAYREGHSTESALLKVKADILHNMEHQKVTLLVLIDLSAAFDTIDHNILLARLEDKFGITGKALQWHKSYLTDRRQCINLSGTRSCEAVLKYGVPQGSCLGPVLFTKYASTLFDVIYKHLDNAHGYADDHQLYLAFSPNSVQLQQNAISCMESCLTDVKQWMVGNKLKMNDSKTEFIIIGSRQQLAKIEFDSIRVGESVVKAVTSVKDLGAFLDSTLSMETHINAKCSAAYRQIYSIRRIRRFISREATETLIHAFIFSHLDYCNGLLYDLPDYQIRKLQRIQNMAARLVFRLPKFSHVTPLMFELHWLPVSYRIQFKLLLFTFKGIHGLGPKYICDMFNVYSSHYAFRRSSTIEDINYEYGNITEPIRQQNVIYLHVPKTKKVTFEQRSLVVAGPTLWNNLPIHLRCVTELDDFKKQLKTHLFKTAYGLS